MKTSEYPTIGQRVNFVRQNKSGEVVTGNGVVLAICLDATKRVMAHIESEKQGEIDGKIETVKDRFNVDLVCLEPTYEFVERFKNETKAISVMSKEGNEKARVIIDRYNKQVDEAYTNLFGSPIEIEA